MFEQPLPEEVVRAGTDNAYKLAKKYNIKTAFGSDILFDARLVNRQGAILAKLVRWYTPPEVLKMATGDNGELMALTGFINPYPLVSSRRAHSPICCLSMATRCKISSSSKTPLKLSGHHEGWHGLQNTAPK